MELTNLDLCPFSRELKNGKRFYRVEKAPDCIWQIRRAPWKGWMPPFRCGPHVYMVSGNIDMAVYLLDTGEGLILIDASQNPLFYLMIDAIHLMGFNPHDIKKILITHGHGDHYGGARALKEMSGAELWYTKADLEYYKTHKPNVPDNYPTYFEFEDHIDHFYDYETPIELGRFSIRTRLCPGHTPGSTAFFFDDTDEETGVTYHLALHGGAGVSGKPGDANNELRKTFIRDCRELAELDVDICLPSHSNQTNFLAWVPDDNRDYTSFIDRDAWRDLMLERADAAEAITEL